LLITIYNKGFLGGGQRILVLADGPGGRLAGQHFGCGTFNAQHLTPNIQPTSVFRANPTLEIIMHGQQDQLRNQG
jgi:hypothetical protein